MLAALQNVMSSLKDNYAEQQKKMEADIIDLQSKCAGAEGKITAHFK